ncbi:MAG: DUF998 domain-containing protein [Caulobacter sp.]|nr:DUF998 domain-containing protein [Caulobacter sp.]
MIRATAFWAAIIGYLLLAILIVGGGAAWPGYSHSLQFISELGAAGAPHGMLVSLGGFLPIGIFVTLFAVLAAVIEPRGLLRTIGFLCLAVFASGYTVAAFFPCDYGCRPATPSFSQLMHNLFGLGGYIFAPIGLIILGQAARTWPGGRWLSPLGLVCGLVAGGAFFGMGSDAPGLAQRVLEGAVALWILACAFTLRRAP